MLPSLVIAVMAAALLLGIRWPGLVLAGMLFTYPAGVAANTGLLGEVYVLSAVVVMFGSNYRSLTKLRVNSLDVAFALLIFWACFAAMWSPLSDGVEARVVVLAISAFAPYIAARLVPPEKITTTVVQFLYGIAFLGAVVGYALITAHAGLVANSARLVIGTASAVGVTQPFPFAILACMALLFRNATAKRLPLLAWSALCALIIIYVSIRAGTRSVFVSAAFGILAALAMTAMKVKVGRPLLLTCVSVVCVLQILPLIPAMEELQLSIDRLLQNFRGDGTVHTDASSHMRVWLYDAAISIFLENPVFGGGSGAVLRMTGWDYPHNIVLEIAAEYGLVGLAFLFSLFAGMFSRAWRLRTQNILAAGVLSALAAAAVMQMMISFGFSMGRPLFLVAGFLAAASFKEHKRSLPSGNLSRRLPREAVGRSAEQPHVG